jgi:hypothetical protein
LIYRIELSDDEVRFQMDMEGDSLREILERVIPSRFTIHRVLPLIEPLPPQDQPEGEGR